MRKSEPPNRSFPRLPHPGVLAAALLVLPPLVWLGASALISPFASGPLLDQRALGLLLRSLLLAVLTCGIALLVGAPFGWSVARYRLAGRQALLYGSLGSLLLPPYAAAHAWGQLLTREGALNQTLLRLGWIQAPLLAVDAPWLSAVILGLAYWPIVAWLAYLAARAVPAELEEEARLHLPAAPAARWAAGPAMRRALPAAGLLVFLLALADFGVPNSLSLKVYPVLIVDRFQTDRNAGAIARLALPLLLLVIPLVRLQSCWLERVPVGWGAGPYGLLSGGFWRVPFCGAVLAVSWILPVAVLTRESLPLSSYARVWAESVGQFANTLVTAGGGAALALALALFYGWATRGRRPGGLDLALTLPYALPASLIGVAMIQLLNHPGPPGWLYDSLAGLVWTYVVLFFPFAHKPLQPAWGQVDEDLLDEATVLGAGAWTRFRTVAWPVLRRPALLAGGIVALLAARELDATALLRPPGGDTVAFQIHDYLHFNPGPNVAALCVLLVLMSAAVGAVLGALAWLGER